MAKLKNIAVASISANLVALRDVDREDQQYLQLRDSIDTMGLMEPIQVAEGPKVEGKLTYTVINGLQRFSCHQDLGIDNIACNILPWDENQMQIGQLAANLRHIATKPSDVTKALHRILNSSPTMTVPRMAKELTLTQQYIGQRLGLKRLGDVIMERVDSGNIPLMSAIALSRLDADDQVAFMAQAETLTHDEFCATATERYHATQKARREGRDKSAPTYVEIPRARSLKVLKEERELQYPTIRELVKDLKSPVEAAIRAIEWTITLDPASIAVAKEKYEQQQAEKVRAAEERKVAVAKKKQEAAAAASAKAQEELAKISQ